ncbi:pleckstrin homology domain-containing family G member 7 isoform X2 [Engraulis encrasicolus]|uniref:pleckstrin homology domain-containing family G member 7 isoform X2 n=1 Tax=Engraulis encrasicolus TaxID=184585 RepID=UPI002FD61C1D
MSGLIEAEIIKENGKDVNEKTFDWSYIEWREDESPKWTSAETQTEPGTFVDQQTQTSHPFILRMDLDRTHSRLRHSSLKDYSNMPTPLFQFDRQAPARISTSPTLRRMRSTRRMDISGPLEDCGPYDMLVRSPLSPLNRQKSPLAASISLPTEGQEQQVCHPYPLANRGKPRSLRSKTLDNGVICKSQEAPCEGEYDNSSIEGGTSEAEQVKELSHKRLQERRRSSVVVSLPGLDMSPGDLFVSNGAADILNHSTFSDTKKSKWPFSRRSTTKGKVRTAVDIDKCLSDISIQDWRDNDFQRYKDCSLEEFLREQCPSLLPPEEPTAHRKQESIWELFTSECVYFLDQLMVLKEVFLTTLDDLHMRDCLQDIDTWRLFANLNELCLVSFNFLSSLLRVLKASWQETDTDSDTDTQALLELLKKAFRESICHCLQKYCLNYSTAVLYLDSLKPREDFSSYVKWCERQPQCRRLQLRDLLVAPLQRFTRYPLLLKNVAKRSQSPEEESSLQEVLELVDRAIYDLEGKVKWLDNYQKVKLLKEALVWLPVWERDKRAYVPENLKHLLKAVTLENLVAHRSLLHEGRLSLIENAKLERSEVFLFLFDEFLLVTKLKRNKKKSGSVDVVPVRSGPGQELEPLLQEGCTFTVLDQPLSLDRLQLKNVDQLNATASSLPHSFILMHQNRYQQCIGAFILQACSEAVKKTWMTEIEKAVTALLKQDSQHPRVKNSSAWLESSQI